MLSSAFGGTVENSLSVVVVAVADFATLDPLYVDSKVGYKREDSWDIFDKYSINRCNLPRINYWRFAIFVHGSERTERARLPSGNLVSRHGIGRGRNPYQSPRREGGRAHVRPAARFTDRGLQKSERGCLLLTLLSHSALTSSPSR